MQRDQWINALYDARARGLLQRERKICQMVPVVSDDWEEVVGASSAAGRTFTTRPAPSAGGMAGRRGSSLQEKMRSDANTIAARAAALEGSEFFNERYTQSTLEKAPGANPAGYFFLAGAFLAAAFFGAAFLGAAFFAVAIASVTSFASSGICRLRRNSNFIALSCQRKKFFVTDFRFFTRIVCLT